MIIYYNDGFAGSREESRRLLKKALTVHTGEEEQAKKLIEALKKGEHGKPFIEGFSCFSISHTGSIWAVLIADRECGLDIQLGRKCDIKAIAERFFAPQDAVNIRSADDFFRVWTRREALTKAVGGSVCETDLPPVSDESVMIGEKYYSIRDIRLPDMPEIYSAICLESNAVDFDPEYMII